MVRRWGAAGFVVLMSAAACRDDGTGGSRSDPPPVVAPDPRVAGFTVVKSLPNDPGEFNQGLEFEQGRM